MRDRSNSVRHGVRRPAIGSGKLRRVRDSVRCRHGVLVGRVRNCVRGTADELLGRVRGPHEQRDQLWRVCSRLRGRRNLHGRRMRLPRWANNVRHGVRRHGGGSSELRRLRHCVCDGTSVQRRHVSHVVRHGADGVWGLVCGSDEQQRQLRRVRHSVRGRNVLLERDVRVPRRPDLVQRRVREHRDGRAQLRRVRNGVYDRSGVQQRSVPNGVRHGAHGVRRYVRGSHVRRHQLRSVRADVLRRDVVCGGRMRLSRGIAALRRRVR